MIIGSSIPPTGWCTWSMAGSCRMSYCTTHCGFANSSGRSSCSTLTPRQLTDVAEHMTKRHYTAGETIIREGEPGQEFFLISEGEVDVVRADHEVARLGSGDFFGEVALISGEARNATVVAISDVDTYVLGKNDFETALATSQTFRDQLYRVYFM